MTLQRCRRTAVCLGILAFLLVSILPAAGRPLPRSQPPRTVTGAGSPYLIGAPHPAMPLGVATADTVVLLGGPERLDGRFEDSEGAPAWHGWTTLDHTAAADTFWSVSTFNAEALGDHGAGNHAMWCGTELPNGEIGYGNNWRQRLGWAFTVPDTFTSATVSVQAWMNHDTEPGFDKVSLQAWRGPDWQIVAEWDGWRINRAVDVSVDISQQDLGGPRADEIRLRFSFVSDEAWSDEDGLYPTDGACQIDDIQVLLDGVVATFDDFEPGSELFWTPRFYDGVGDFVHLAANLNDLDPCRSNSSVQAVFIDDGLVVPGTGGSPCLSWCYGPSGFVVNSYGGLLGLDYHLDNGLVSPPLAWPDGTDDMLLAFDVYVHEPLALQSPGIVYRWRVRSTADDDPAVLEDAAWRHRDVVYTGGPAYRRHHELCGELLVPGRRWVQVELQVMDFRAVWELDGHDATPAPYFDNVAVKVFASAGPRIMVADAHLPQDTFPQSGNLDLRNLETNSCRFDMALNISPPEHLRNDPGDSIVAEVHVLRDGEELTEQPRLVARLRANPLFDLVRSVQPDPDGCIDLVATGDSCRTAVGAAIPNRWFFDLPDTGLIFPGDVVHFFLEARAFGRGQQTLVTWPADTTGFGDFSATSVWPEFARMRALPTVFSDEFGDQPRLLLWRDDAQTVEAVDYWDHTLRMLGLHRGLDYDLFRTRSPADGAGNGLGGRARAAQLAGYNILLYDSGDLTAYALTGAAGVTATEDVRLLAEWFAFGDKRALLTGDNLASDLAQGAMEAQLFLSGYLGVQLEAADGGSLMGGQQSPRIAILPDNGVFVTTTAWQVLGGCPDPRRLDLVTAGGLGQRLAEYTAPNGAGGVYPYAAATRLVMGSPQRDIVSLPYSFSAIGSLRVSGGENAGVPARVRLLAEVLTAFGIDASPTTAVPETSPQLAAGSRPNPFNPRTTIFYEVSAPGPVKLAIYDVRGRQVRVLVDGWHRAGSAAVAWDGCDAEGRACASGVFIHVLETAAGRHLGKMTLVR
ncbi:MAG: hypothetical protein PHQ53_03800 [Candidatus Krumholzibacteria bacterium]|nr:hypothetical protein [Candidatus Krumholzibacteria bacterium]